MSNSSRPSTIALHNPVNTDRCWIAPRLSHHFRPVAACLGFILLASITSQAQDKTPQRGFTPNGSYALTDLETINTSNGNMMLRIPIASLPPTRGGMTANLFLIYNSKLCLRRE